uniref:C2H2-type domain-containing protein n=1 Tax=Anguilla anguilla TaxID=7936 RepID=A0A0E9V5C4_ANGAN
MSKMQSILFLFQYLHCSQYSRCTAEGCSEAFSTNTNMKKHFTRKHQNKKNCTLVNMRLWKSVQEE